MLHASPSDNKNYVVVLLCTLMLTTPNIYLLYVIFILATSSGNFYGYKIIYSRMIEMGKSTSDKNRTGFCRKGLGKEINEFSLLLGVLHRLSNKILSTNTLYNILKNPVSSSVCKYCECYEPARTHVPHETGSRTSRGSESK